MTKPFASLSLDLDNKWSYLKTHGDEGWDKYPTYLDVVVPRVLDLLAEVDVKITFFVVGQDAARKENQAALQAIVDAGHEIGNHSFNHEPWLHLYSPEEIEQELSRTEHAIEQATGKTPIGFRGPGFSSSPTLLEILEERGYPYDASKLPTFIGPLARMYYFFRSSLSGAELEDRNQLFGTWREVFCKLKPFWWKWQESEEGKKQLLEIPVTTMPIFRLPFHVSYLQYLLKFSKTLAWLYWGMAMQLCRITKTEPSLLLHPLDFMDAKEEPRLGFFPGMDLDQEYKCEFIRNVLNDFTKRYQVLTMSEHAQHLKERQGLSSVTLESALDEQDSNEEEQQAEEQTEYLDTSNNQEEYLSAK